MRLGGADETRTPRREFDPTRPSHGPVVLASPHIDLGETTLGRRRASAGLGPLASCARRLADPVEHLLNLYEFGM